MASHVQEARHQIFHIQMLFFAAKKHNLHIETTREETLRPSVADEQWMNDLKMRYRHRVQLTREVD